MILFTFTIDIDISSTYPRLLLCMCRPMDNPSTCAVDLLP